MNKKIVKQIKHKQDCKKILEISPKIRYAGVTNEFGRTISGQLKAGITPYLRTEDIRNEFFIHSMVFSVRNNYKKSIGDTEYLLFESTKVRVVSFMASKLIYYVTIEKRTSNNELFKIIENIMDKIQSF